MAIGGALVMMLKDRQLGRYYGDGMMLSHAGVGLATEPNGLFVAAETRRSGRITARCGAAGPEHGVILEGTPDMVLEVISRSSVRKDTVDLLDLYSRAGIREYWLVDPRGDEPRFTLYAHTARGYRAVRPADGWRKSAVFGAAFRLVQSADDPDLEAYTLEMR
jgi:Uma2 family endonuclease